MSLSEKTLTMTTLIPTSSTLDIRQPKKRLQRFKFCLSAYREHRMSPVVLKLSGTDDDKYHEFKKEKNSSPMEKGTWAIVPIPETELMAKTGEDSTQILEMEIRRIVNQYITILRLLSMKATTCECTDYQNHQARLLSHKGKR
jgi:hypothetical protein